MQLDALPTFSKPATKEVSFFLGKPRPIYFLQNHIKSTQSAQAHRQQSRLCSVVPFRLFALFIFVSMMNYRKRSSTMDVSRRGKYVAGPLSIVWLLVLFLFLVAQGICHWYNGMLEDGRELLVEMPRPEHDLIRRRPGIRNTKPFKAPSNSRKPFRQATETTTKSIDKFLLYPKDHRISQEKKMVQSEWPCPCGAHPIHAVAAQSHPPGKGKIGTISFNHPSKYTRTIDIGISVDYTNRSGS